MDCIGKLAWVSTQVHGSSNCFPIFVLGETTLDLAILYAPVLMPSVETF